MNKEQSADDPSVDLICVKICLIALFLSEYNSLDVVIACIEHGCLWKHSEQLRYRSTIII